MVRVASIMFLWGYLEGSLFVSDFYFNRFFSCGIKKSTASIDCALCLYWCFFSLKIDECRFVSN